MSKKRKKMPLWLVGIVFLIGSLLAMNAFIGGGRMTTPVSAKTITVYKSKTCGCCMNYVSYLKRAGYDVDFVNIENLSSIKTKYGIPSDMESCHTSVIDDGEYVIEGHIPFEGMEALFSDETGPRIIALPDMPVGSPGMPGRKQEPFTIFQIEDGTIEEYMKL